MKRLTNFLFALVLTAAITSCVYDFGNNTGASGDVPNKSSNRITSLQAVINNAKEGDTINLSEHNITDFSATINKAVTINAANKNMNSGSLSIAASGVTLNGLSNVNVTASPSLGNGSLKISGSSLNSLNILGGGLNSIHLLNGTTIIGKTIIGKEYNAAQNDQEPVRLVMDSTIIIADLTIKSSAVLDSGTSEVNNDNLKSVIFAIDETNAETSVNVAVSANLSFRQQTNWAKVQFQSSTASDASMSIYVMKKNETVTISKDFFTDAFQRLIGEVTKEEVEAEFSDYVDTPIEEPVSPISVDSLITPVTVTFCYNNGDATEDFTFAKGKKLDVAAQGKTKRGYVLLGWSTTSGAGEADSALTVGESVTVNEDETFYFVWKKDNTTTNIEYDGSFTKWSFSGNIAEISKIWDSSSDDPKFGILFMDSQTINEMMNLDDEILADGESTNQWLFSRPSGHSVYQLVRKNDNGIENLTFSTSQTGTYKTHYDGLISSINDGTKYAIYLDKDKIKKTDIWAFGQGYSTSYDVSGDIVTKNEQQLTDDDELNLTGYIPILLALYDNSHDQNYLTQFWMSSMIRMSPYKGDLPSAQDLPSQYDTNDLTFDGTIAELSSWMTTHNTKDTSLTYYLIIRDESPDIYNGFRNILTDTKWTSPCILDLSNCSTLNTLGTWALRSANMLTKVILPNSITTITGGALSDCSSLTEVVIAGDNSAYQIIDGVVFNNDKTTIVLYPAGKTDLTYSIPDSVTTIGQFAFYGTHLTTINIPEGVTSIGDLAFARMSNLSSITIPANVATIGMSVFSKCDSLTSINVDSANNAYKSDDDVLFSKNGKYLLCYPAGKMGESYNVPNGVVELKTSSFANCKSLREVVLPSGITTIYTSAFSGCENLTSIVLPDTVTTIYTETFSGCTSLTDIIIPSNIANIPSFSFSGCTSLARITVEATNPPEIGTDAFKNCNAISTINVPADSVEIYKAAEGWSAYADKIQASGTGSGGTTSSFNDASSDYATILASITYDESYDVSVSDLSAWLAEHIATDKIYRVKITDANPDMNTFKGLMKGYVSDPRKISLDLWDCTGLSTIDDAVFDEWHSLVNIILPKNISTVTGYGIGYCPNLKNVYVDNGNTLFYSRDGVLFDKDKTKLIKYPSAKEGTSYDEIPDSVTSIDNYAFSYASHLTSVTIPSSVVSIGDSAFMQSGLTTLSISSSAIKIFDSAFEKCEQLQNVTIQSNVSYFGNRVFAYCNNLESITLSGTDSVLSLDDKGVLFNKDQTKLICYPASKDTVDTTYDIPTSVTEIGPCAFARSFKLNKVTINSDISTIGDFAFSECYHDNTIDNPFTLIMNDSTPPVLGQDIFLYITNLSIQVPSGSVTDYESSWSAYAGKIQAISSSNP